MVFTDQQILPNEILAEVAYYLIQTSTARRGAALRLVNKFFAAEVDRLFFDEALIDEAIFRNRKYVTASLLCIRCIVYCRDFRSFPFGNALRNDARILEERWLVRYWAGFVRRSDEECPEILRCLRTALVNGLEIYGAFDIDQTNQTLRTLCLDDDRASGIQVSILDPLETDQLFLLCEAAVLLLGSRVAWCLLEREPFRPNRCAPGEMMERLSEHSGILWACVLAAFRREFDHLQTLLDNSCGMGKAEKLAHLSELRAVTTHRRWVLNDRLLNDPIMVWLNCLAACLVITVRKSDREMFDFLLDYDKDTKVIGSGLFRSCRFFDNRNVQEVTVSCGEVEMFTALMQRGWQSIGGEPVRLLLGKSYAR